MDPYLEHPLLWPGVHQRLITHIGDTLNTALPADYVADIGERLYVVRGNRNIFPDVVLLQHPPAPRPGDGGRGGTAAAVAVASDPPWVFTFEPMEVREVFVEIWSLAEKSRVVTVIEVLSPSNKTPGHPGRQLYLTKQQDILQSPTHLIEIDLLRTGEHTVAPPLEWLLQRGPWDYLVSLHRGGEENRYEVWGIPLRQRLPRIRVPLAGDDPDVVLDLQAVFDRCYDQGAYARRVDYRADPPTPLQGDEAAWADALLRERGLRG